MAEAIEVDLFGQPITFGRRFLERHAGHVMDDPRIALVELVANAYDAGATSVKIEWPDQRGGSFAISDNGIGMTKDQFARRWRQLNYSRLDEQGTAVEFPPKTRGVQPRTAFGQSGIGRHGAFCFSDQYTLVITSEWTPRSSRLFLVRPARKTPRRTRQ